MNLMPFFSGGGQPNIIGLCLMYYLITGTTEPNRIYVTRLNGKISRTQLLLYMDEIAECEVIDVFYGLNPEVAMVTYKDKIGKT